MSVQQLQHPHQGGSLNDRKEMFRSMLTDAVAVLCRNTMPYSAELSIEGLIGITADKKDIVLVNINEIIGLAGKKLASPDVQNSDCLASPPKPKSRKRKKMRLSSPDQPQEHKLAKLQENANLVNQLKELTEFDVDSLVKKEVPPATPYGGYRNELYNTNDHQLEKTDTPSFPAVDELHQFTDATTAISTADFTAFSSSDAAAALSQPHSELLIERLDENGTIIYQCTICQKIIKSKGNFGRHIKGHVNSAVIHTCDLCGKTFGRKDNLRRHLNMVHQVETPTKLKEGNDDENGDSVDDIIPGLGESMSDALNSTNEQLNNHTPGNKPMFELSEDNHAAKYFQQHQQHQQHSISSLGLDSTKQHDGSNKHLQPNHPTQLVQDVPAGSVTNMPPVYRLPVPAMHGGGGGGGGGGGRDDNASTQSDYYQAHTDLPPS